MDAPPGRRRCGGWDDLNWISSCTQPAVDPRQQLQALQTHMISAHAALDAGDRASALEHIEAALVIDPNFLAAQTLRDRLQAPVEAAGDVARPSPSPSPSDTPAASALPPLVSVEGYAKFEQRAKRRRVDRRMDAARSALQRGRMRGAGAA